MNFTLRFYTLLEFGIICTYDFYFELFETQNADYELSAQSLLYTTHTKIKCPLLLQEISFLKKLQEISQEKPQSKTAPNLSSSRICLIECALASHHPLGPRSTTSNSALALQYIPRMLPLCGNHHSLTHTQSCSHSSPLSATSPAVSRKKIDRAPRPVVARTCMHGMAATSVPVAAWAALLLLSAAGCAGQALVPGVMIFGDSVVDAGNNNRLATLVRADFPPYGRDFPATHAPTGRFCNGKLATDYTGTTHSELLLLLLFDQLIDGNVVRALCGQSRTWGSARTRRRTWARRRRPTTRASSTAPTSPPAPPDTSTPPPRSTYVTRSRLPS